MDGLNVVFRNDWDAEAPSEPVPKMKHPVEYVIYTHSLKVDKCYTEEECKIRVKDLQTQHMAEGHPDILYNFLIGGDGTAYEGRGWNYEPDKSLIFPQYHGNRVDIAYLGNYEGGPPPPNMWKIANKIVNQVFDANPPLIQMASYRLLQWGIDMGHLNPEHYPHDTVLCDETPQCPCTKSDMSLSFISMQPVRDLGSDSGPEPEIDMPDYDYPDDVLDRMPDENLNWLPPPRHYYPQTEEEDN